MWLMSNEDKEICKNLANYLATCMLTSLMFQTELCLLIKTLKIWICKKCEAESAYSIKVITLFSNRSFFQGSNEAVYV